MKTGKKFISPFLLAGLFFFHACDQGETKPETYASIEGLYSCQENSIHTGLRKYFIEIDRVNDSEDTFIITNFHNLGESEFLYMEYRPDSIHIENQYITNYRIKGKGTADASFRRIELYYETDDGSIIQDYYATYTR